MRNRSLLVLLLVAVVGGSAMVVLASTAMSTHSPAKGTSSAPPGGVLPANPPLGYHRVFADDFKGTSLSSAWHRYRGQPGSDTGGWWDPSHVSLADGMLTLRTYEDATHYHQSSGPPWVEGGVDLWPSGVLVNGDYQVRSRVSSPAGVTQVLLLWPDSNDWPPEIDFSESNGTNESTATLIWGSATRTQIQQATLAAVDLTQWHTWGVVVTPGTLTYTLDGATWATMPNHEQVPMNLAIQQQVWPCGASPSETCPSAATPPEVVLYVDWVAVYAPNP